MAVVIEGTERIDAPIDAVWAAIKDPEVLRQAIPGCEQLTRLADREMRARVRLSIGPVKAAFGGQVTLENVMPPRSYMIRGAGSGGIGSTSKKLAGEFFKSLARSPGGRSTPTA